MPTSVRLDRKTEKLLERLARERAQTKSEVIRQAIESFANGSEPPANGETILQQISDLVGCVGGGPVDASERTGEKFRDLLRSRERSS